MTKRLCLSVLRRRFLAPALLCAALALGGCQNPTASGTATRTITFVANNGSYGMVTQTLAEGATAALKANTFTNGDYIFLGWNASSGDDWNTILSIPVAEYGDGEDYTMGEADVTLYAQWSDGATTCTINYNDGNDEDSTAMDTETVIVGSRFKLTKNAYTYANHEFAGWAVQEDVVCKSCDDQGWYTATGNITLNAVWVYDATYADLSAGGYIGLVDVGTKGSILTYANFATFEYTTEETTYLSPYRIGKYEVTRELYYAVMTWSRAHGYSYTRPMYASALEGDYKLYPISSISWRSAMIWCNAYTEWYNAQTGAKLECAYYMDSGYETPCRSI